MNNNSKEIYFLVGIKLPNEDPLIIQDSMEELAGLVKTAGGKVGGSLVQNRQTIDPAFYIGKGKAEELDLIFDKMEDQVVVIVFNAVLRPSQVQNLEEILLCRVITRTELILDIFAIHAQSRVAKLQVEAAQLSYLLPRLAGSRDNLSRTGGGIGTRGPGETKLETDRRKIRNRLTLLKRELKTLEKAAIERRKSREDIFKIAVVGYTNAGKSALTSKLTRKDLYIQDELFATVDTATKRLILGGMEAVLTDTVGFIRDIPHELIDSFHSTLIETIYADLILHVVDISSSFFSEKIDTAEKLLKEIKAEAPILVIFNKIDLISSEELLNYRSQYPEALFVSVKDGEGIEELKKILQQKIIDFIESKGQKILDYQFLIK